MSPNIAQRKSRILRPMQAESRYSSSLDDMGGEVGTVESRDCRRWHLRLTPGLMTNPGPLSLAGNSRPRSVILSIVLKPTSSYATISKPSRWFADRKLSKNEHEWSCSMKELKTKYGNEENNRQCGMGSFEVDT